MKPISFAVATRLLAFASRNWLSLLCGASILLNAALLVDVGLLKQLSSLPAGVATLAAATLAFCGVAWQTNRGFKNLIASQEHRAQLDRTARQEELDLAAQKAERERRSARTSLSAAMQGELAALETYCENTRLTCTAMSEVYKSLGNSQLTHPPTALIAFRPRIYDANISNLGLFPSSLVAEIATVYSASTVTPELSKVSRADVLTKSYHIYSIVLSNLKKRARHLAQRLDALDHNVPDPGPFPEELSFADMELS